MLKTFVKKLPPIKYLIDERDELKALLLEYETYFNEPQDAAPPAPNRWFIVHVAKSGGTSFRNAVLSSAPLKIFPTHAELNFCSNGQYLTAGRLRQRYNRSPIMNRQLIMGHYSYRFFKDLDPTRRIGCFFRNPVNRMISNAHHFSRHTDRFRNWSIIDIMRSEEFLSLANYQTKILSMPTHDEVIDIAMRKAEPDIELALQNLGSLDFIGITEHLDVSIRNISALSGIEIDSAPRINVAPSYTPTDLELSLASEITRLDSRLYEAALNIFFKN